MPLSKDYFQTFTCSAPSALPMTRLYFHDMLSQILEGKIMNIRVIAVEKPECFSMKTFAVMQQSLPAPVYQYFVTGAFSLEKGPSEIKIHHSPKCGIESTLSVPTDTCFMVIGGWNYRKLWSSFELSNTFSLSEDQSGVVPLELLPPVIVLHYYDVEFSAEIKE